MAKPFYDRDDDKRAFRASVVRLCNGFGTPRICPRHACWRRGSCADEDMHDLPFCFWHYRGSIRLAMAAAFAHYGIKPGVQVADDGERKPAPPWTGPSLLDRLAASGAPVDDLRRPTDAGEDPWTWERDERARALVDSFNRPPPGSRENR
jgi:hypothetical protein